MTRKTARKQRPVRVGIVGVSRGQSFFQGPGSLTGLECVALCDVWKEKLRAVGKQHRVATYTDYDKFLAHDMDAVILANYFHEHTPFAIKALEAGKHVMSECTSNATVAEGVALCRAVEKSGLIYMLAENYPYTVFNMEMRRVYRTGEIGEVTYAEGEYNHPLPMESFLALSPGLEHWRSWLPSTYYCTHALAPLMYITNTMPTKVNGLSITSPSFWQDSVRRGDPGSVILCRMDNGAIFRLFGVLIPGHSAWYRLHGTRGAMENVRGTGYFGPGQVRVWHEPWDLQEGEVIERTYLPDWPEHTELAHRAGHGGGDFWTCFEFANAIRSGEQPFLDVYRGVAMSTVGILAWRSALAEGAPLALPDFRKEASRKIYENDHASPFPDHARLGWEQVPSSVLGSRTPPRRAVTEARRSWKTLGYPVD